MLEIDRAFLVGNSMGGRVALEVGLRAPGRVSGLALLCPAVAFIKREFHPIVRLLRPELGLLPHAIPRPLVARQFWSLFNDREAIDGALADVVVDGFRKSYAAPAARHAFLASARNIYLDAPFGRSGFYPRLAELRPDARARSCWRAAATCRRSSARTRSTRCWPSSSPTAPAPSARRSASAGPPPDATSVTLLTDRSLRNAHGLVWSRVTGGPGTARVPSDLRRGAGNDRSHWVSPCWRPRGRRR